MSPFTQSLSANHMFGAKCRLYPQEAHKTKCGRAHTGVLGGLSNKVHTISIVLPSGDGPTTCRGTGCVCFYVSMSDKYFHQVLGLSLLSFRGFPG